MQFLASFWPNQMFLMYFNWPSEKSVRQWSGRPGFNPWSRHTEDFKMVLDTTLLNTQQYKVRIEGKVEQSRERSCPLPYTEV